MKTRLLIAASVILSALLAQSIAATSTSPTLLNPLTVSLAESKIETTFLTGSVDTDGFVYTSRPVAQTEFTFPITGDYYGYVRHVGSLSMKTNPANEVFISIGWAHEGAIDIDLNFGYNDFVTLFKGPAEDVWIATARVSKTYDLAFLGVWKPFAEVTNYKAAPKSSFTGGMRAQAGIEGKFDRGEHSVEYSCSFLRDDGTYDNKPLWLMNHTASILWKQGKSTIRFPGVSLYVPLTPHSGKKVSVVWSAGFIYDF